MYYIMLIRDGKALRILMEEWKEEIQLMEDLEQ